MTLVLPLLFYSSNLKINTTAILMSPESLSSLNECARCFLTILSLEFITIFGAKNVCALDTGSKLQAFKINTQLLLYNKPKFLYFSRISPDMCSNFNANTYQFDKDFC